MRGRLREHRRRRICAASVILLCASGCILEGPLSVRRVWFDHNTLNTPAVYYEKIHRMPPDSARVKQMRWMYGKSPGREDLPLAECEADEQCPYDIPLDAQPPPKGYIPLPSPPQRNDKAPEPIPPKHELKPPLPGRLPDSTAKGSETPKQTIMRTSARSGDWRFTVER